MAKEPHESHGTNTSANLQTCTEPRQEDTYGPWMVVACGKSGSKSAKGMDPIKDFVASKQRVELRYRAYPVTKLDQSRAGKGKH